MRLILVALVLTLACNDRGTDAPPMPSSVTRLGPADVSVLFPASAELWRADLATVSGPLLPRERFALNKRSLTKELPDDAEYEALRVVSMRFDPCFQRSVGGPCEPQIRLVFQASPDGKTFLDGAVHALYALPPAAFEAALGTLDKLIDTPAEGPLGVHPRLAREGVGGPLGSGLLRIAKDHLGPATLTRVTFMTRTEAPAGQWQFSGFEILENQDDARDHARIPIAGIGATMQNVTRNRRGPDTDVTFDYTVHPLFAEKDGRRGASGLYLAELPLEARSEVHAWALRQESPSSHVPDSTDCASCHVANHVGRHLESLSPELGRPTVPRHIAINEPNPDNLRAFGYFDTEPQVAQRTANETAAVLARLALPKERWFTP
ncbi:MAG TPA: hypothetical protein PK095_16530 [Myxococcota bacterium]|nr:hypothetical protein [Myxococcota bacterium]